MNLNGKKRDIARDTKTKAVLARIHEVCKEQKVRFVVDEKNGGNNGNMITDGRRILSAPICTFPSAEAVALAFCHELGHLYIWREEKSGAPRCRDKFDEELTAWSLGIGLWHRLFRGIRMRSFARNFPLRRYVMSRLATYAGMFNIVYEGFYYKGKPQTFTMNASGGSFRLCKPGGGEGK